MNAPSQAQGFAARAGLIDGFDAVELSDRKSGARALFARRGATLVDWRVAVGTAWLTLTDGYADPAELALQDGVRNGLLAPFSNRIAGARYTFDGQLHDLLPGTPEGARLIYHGFLRRMNLALLTLREGQDRASAVFGAQIRPDDFPGYPFALALEVEVALDAQGIAYTIAATNVGHTTAPYGCGWHPYFRLGDAPLERLELSIPASETVRTDSALIPLSGAPAYVPTMADPQHDFRQPRPLGTQVIDACYAGLRAGPDGLIHSTLRDPLTGHRLALWQQRGLVHLFTGDTLARDPRRALALEPVEFMTDAFNRDECNTALRLAPGASRSFSFGARFQRGSESPTPHAAHAARDA